VDETWSLRNAISPTREGSSALQQRTRAGVSFFPSGAKERSSFEAGAVVLPVLGTNGGICHSAGVERGATFVDAGASDVGRPSGGMGRCSSLVERGWTLVGRGTTQEERFATLVGRAASRAERFTRVEGRGATLLDRGTSGAKRVTPVEVGSAKDARRLASEEGCSTGEEGRVTSLEEQVAPIGGRTDASCYAFRAMLARGAVVGGIALALVTGSAANLR
jgi:hypothetical protein